MIVYCFVVVIVSCFVCVIVSFLVYVIVSCFVVVIVSCLVSVILSFLVIVSCFVCVIVPYFGLVLVVLVCGKWLNESIKRNFHSLFILLLPKFLHLVASKVPSSCCFLNLQEENAEAEFMSSSSIF